MTRKKLDERILITGGGSGGHIAAATAILTGLRERYENVTEQILYIGSNLSMEGDKSKSLEEKIISGSDIPYRSIRAGKLQRYFSLHTITLLFGVLGGLIDSWRVISEFQPEKVISTGGYVTVPVCIVARLRNIPVYIHEQTAAVGLTNKISGIFAHKVYTSFESSSEYFPKGKVLHTGNAVRPEIFKTDGKGEVQEAIDQMLPSRKKLPIVLITGGGQGSHIINITVRQMLTYLTEEFQVILQTGDNQVHRDHDILIKERMKMNKDRQSRFFPTKFINAQEIGHVFANTDIFVGRSGANFVYEMGVLKIPSILIPIPWVTHNEQERNADVLADTGLARILPEGELTAERLFGELQKMKGQIRNGSLKIDEAKLEKSFPLDAVERIIDDLDLKGR